ncbi:E3 ubiquitin-protein ligase CBL-B [Strongyloides ratti]|uniref:E3 ubiquitin-protein ligase CBL n=1 Tax=Strongyloides ratti TaxID=34506 RepID=A0A090KP50_STRRB|nr:E3 ubiquitin-protein ligase CBL-B [Strongyloides ratti]CEF59378.1 E3 ubiquitin-protein ligase CBL-B [Strongyloides ratti]
MTTFTGIINRFQNLFGSPLNALEDSIVGVVNRNCDIIIKFQSNDHPLVPQDDAKVFDKTFRLLDNVFKLCQKPKLKLKPSPPNILEIIPDIYKHLNLILKENPSAYSEILYLRLYMTNLDNKCKGIIKLLKDSKDDIYDEESVSRLSLTKKVLSFSHMYYELIALSPEGKLSSKSFRITKQEASQFWYNNFGDLIIVPWNQFENLLKKVHIFSDNSNESNSLKKTMDLTSNCHISQFEFDVFTRLFQPWDKLLDNWRVLAVKHPAYVSFLTYDQVKSRLEKFINKPGSYVFRLSCTRLGHWAIGYVAPDGKIYQTIPNNKSLVKALVDGYREGFYRYPNGEDYNPDLTKELETSNSGKTVHVTQEQFEIYCSIGSTFEMCKICDENDKDVRLEPCGHLICKTCLTSWQEVTTGIKNCPFCRCEIKGIEEIVIRKYSNYLSNITGDGKNNEKKNEDEVIMKNKLHLPIKLSFGKNNKEKQKNCDKTSSESSPIDNLNNLSSRNLPKIPNSYNNSMVVLTSQTNVNETPL